MKLAVAAFAIFALGRVTIAADIPGLRVLVDFADSKGLTLNGSQARFDGMPLDHGQGLRITTEAAAEYPSVQIEPKAGKWDLTGFDGVEMEVRNPQEVAVRVLLSVNNPAPMAVIIATWRRSRSRRMKKQRSRSRLARGMARRTIRSIWRTSCRSKSCSIGRANRRHSSSAAFEPSILARAACPRSPPIHFLRQ